MKLSARGVVIAVMIQLALFIDNHFLPRAKMARLVRGCQCHGHSKEVQKSLRQTLVFLSKRGKQTPQGAKS